MEMGEVRRIWREANLENAFEKLDEAFEACKGEASREEAAYLTSLVRLCAFHQQCLEEGKTLRISTGPEMTLAELKELRRSLPV